MKINESTLAAFATSQSVPSDKEGWLWKKGEVNKAFQRRYFVLKGNLLFYFEKRSDKEPTGVIILEGCIVELAEEDTERFGFKICFHQAERSRVYHMGTELQQTLMEWMRLLACASHDYMKLMVYELQQKLSELDAAAAAGNAQGPPSLGGARATSAVARRNPFAAAAASEDEASTLESDRPKTDDVPSADGRAEGTPRDGPVSTWNELHKLYGRGIARDYQDYLSKL